MRAIQLKIDPFEFISTLEWNCIKEMGEHGVLKVKGVISEENRTRYYNKATSEVWVNAKAISDEEEEITLFTGILTNLTIHSQHELHTMEIEVTTGTILLDQTLHTRAFQDSTTSYESAINTCIKPVGGQMIMRGNNDATIGRFTLQYQETNWLFIKRLSARLGQPLLPEFYTEGKRFYIGLNRAERARELVASNFTFSRGRANNHETSIGNSYQVNSREIHELGQSILFDGKRLVIGKVNSRLQGEELWHEYTLLTSAPLLSAPQNPKLTGLSLRAKVTNVSRDRVQIDILAAENRQDQGRRWFDYATVYSTPEGAGFYAMPTAGNEVRLIFSEGDETRAYVANSIHLSTKGGRTNPDHKSFRNDQGMEILMTPTEIVLKDDHGQLLELSDSKGITINSNHAIDISSNKQIRINSNSVVNLSAQDQVSIQQKSSRIHMNDSIDISGGKINMN